MSLVTRGTRIVSRREFAVSGAGATEFERYLAGMADVPTHIFTDLAEEDFRLDTIPHVGKRDREAILNRKLAQIFRNTPYRHALLQGREAEGRRDDRVIYTAITNPEVLRPWLEIIERLKVPLAGIHSAAVFSSVLLEELDLLFPHTLLVTFTPGDAMRQTYFRDREIKFSRLTPIDLEEGQTLGTMIAEETTRTWQYLDSLRHFAPDDRLEVCILLHPNDRPAIEPALRDFAQLQYRLLDIEQVAQKLGLKPPPLDSTAEEVMVHLFLLRKAREPLRLPGAAPPRDAAQRAHRAHAGRRRHPRREPRLGRLERLARVPGERSRPEGGPGAADAQPRLRRHRARVALLRRGRLDHARCGDVLQRLDPRLSDARGLRAPALERAARAIPGVRLSQLAWQATDDPKATPRSPSCPRATRRP